jgi:hypothetical protein
VEHWPRRCYLRGAVAVVAAVVVVAERFARSVRKAQMP